MSRPRQNEGWNSLSEVAASTLRISQFDIPDDSDVTVRNEAVNGRYPSDGTFQPQIQGGDDPIEEFRPNRPSLQFRQRGFYGA